ncbi:hypothetical protein Q5P01_011996 [Channa striata]|uniref:SCAN box domain-containing protein n=1 Tax=Channa striata TaxID=64152 RepID=A0AA88MMU4_CHASR|nr:hypothetical protein Q5P01_011996 [Channa striata]
MEFHLDEFRTNPSVEKFNKCKKADLLIVADLFDVPPPVATSDDGGLKFPTSPAPPMDALIHPGMTAEELQLVLHIKEVEGRNKQLERETMHLRVRALELERGQVSAATPTSQSTPTPAPIDSYFCAFERIASALRWPKDVWLVGKALVGKAQEVCATLSLEQSLNYDTVKTTLLRAYELVPEAYRQKFRECRKTVNQTYVEFACEKCTLLDKWCSATETKAYEQLWELVLLEEFKNCLPKNIVVYLNEQKVPFLSRAAVLADEFVLTHKNVFALAADHDVFSPSERHKSMSNPWHPLPVPLDKRAYYYCREHGHLIADCPMLKKKELKKIKGPSPISLIQTRSLTGQNAGGTLMEEKCD